jgi:hypothetical protein
MMWATFSAMLRFNAPSVTVSLSAARKASLIFLYTLMTNHTPNLQLVNGSLKLDFAQPQKYGPMNKPYYTQDPATLSVTYISYCPSARIVYSNSAAACHWTVYPLVSRSQLFHSSVYPPRGYGSISVRMSSKSLAEIGMVSITLPWEVSYIYLSA